MKEAGKTYEPVTYEGAGHGFMRAGEEPDATEANKKARAESWVAMEGPVKEDIKRKKRISRGRKATTCGGAAIAEGRSRTRINLTPAGATRSRLS